jgi:hypothetical protein
LNYAENLHSDSHVLTLELQTFRTTEALQALVIEDIPNQSLSKENFAYGYITALSEQKSSTIGDLRHVAKAASTQGMPLFLLSLLLAI